jgi:hypothetical protein
MKPTPAVRLRFFCPSLWGTGKVRGAIHAVPPTNMGKLHTHKLQVRFESRCWLHRRGQQCFGSFVDLNSWPADRCRALCKEARRPGPDSSAWLHHKRAHLMPMPAPFDGYVERCARVSRTCLVSVARNRCSVLCELAGQMVSMRLYPYNGLWWRTMLLSPATSFAAMKPRRATTGSTTSR